MSGVNLDAYIRREDLRFINNDNDEDFGLTSEKTLFELQEGQLFFSLLRKPDFQRETDDWEIKKVANLIENFLDGDLIPAVILWKSPNHLVYVLDGAHRLSAIASWVNDDYGDGKISQRLYGNFISEEQLLKAVRTRELINKRIGSYKDHIKCDPSLSTPLAERAKRLSLRKIDIQWVRGNAKKAEESFFRINQNASKLTNTEIFLLKQRKSPLAIASRAIIRNGSGHKYWANFENSMQKNIEEVAKEVHNLLFLPKLNKGVLNTLELPIGGIPHSNATLTMVYDLVKIINENFYAIKEEKNENSDYQFQLSLFDEELSDNLESVEKPKTEDDKNGSSTLDVLNNCKRIFKRINSNTSASLGLSPAVYFYSHRTGNFQVTSFMATIEFVKYLETNDLLKTFTKYRKKFEEIIILHNHFIEQTVSKFGSGSKGYKHIKNLYVSILSKLMDEKDNDSLIGDLINDGFDYLKIQQTPNENISPNFTKNTKNAVFIKHSLKNSLKCQICYGHIHKNAITYDHVIRKADGGKGMVDNGQLAHPYCNTVYKN
jgi:hypothetical protein